MPDEQVITAQPDGGADAGADVDLGFDVGTLDAPDSNLEVPETKVDEQQPPEGQRQPEKKDEQEEPEVSELKGQVSARLRGLVKQAPELSGVFQKYPAIQQTIEAAMRRDSAYREFFPTVAEAREMREIAPNGVQDIRDLMAERESIQQTDNLLYNRDQSGNYSGHEKLIQDYWNQDQAAMRSLFRTVPRQWSRLDPEGYNDVMGKIVGATFQQREIPQYLDGLIADADAAGATEISKGLKQLSGWVKSFSADKPKPTAEQERLATERQQFEREKAERDKTDRSTFDRTFATTNLTLQRSVISEHPAMKALEKVKDITAGKRADILEQVRKQMETTLKNSVSFMSKLRAAYQSRNIEEAKKLQMAAWKQPWLLNRSIRAVLQKEVPQLLNANRERLGRHAAAPQTKTPANNGDRTRTRTGPYQENGRWFKANGQRFSVEEVLRSEHLKP